MSLFHSLLSTKIRKISENKAYLFAPFLHYQPVKEGESKKKQLLGFILSPCTFYFYH